MKNILNLFLAGAILFSGCATDTVSSDYDRAMDFSKLKTYQWAGDPKPTGDLRFDDPDLRKAIKQSVETELQAKGLKESSGGQADLLLKDYITVEQKKESVGAPYLPDFNPRAGVTGMADTYAIQQMKTFQYEDGTFVLDMTDPGSGKILWRGTLEGMVDPGATPAKRIERVPAAVAKVLKDFPPVKK